MHNHNTPLYNYVNLVGWSRLIVLVTYSSNIAELKGIVVEDAFAQYLVPECTVCIRPSTQSVQLPHVPERASDAATWTLQSLFLSYFRLSPGNDHIKLLVQYVVFHWASICTLAIKGKKQQRRIQSVYTETVLINSWYHNRALGWMCMYCIAKQKELIHVSRLAFNDSYLGSSYCL